MRERILQTAKKPVALDNGNPPRASQASASQTSSAGSRGQTNGALEPGPLAYQATASHRQTIASALSQTQARLANSTPLRIPKPSEMFGIRSGFDFGATPTNPIVQQVSRSPVVSQIPNFPAPGQLTPASVTRQKEHTRRLKGLSNKLQKKNLKRRMEAATQSDQSRGPPDADAVWYPFEGSEENGHMGALSGVLGGFREWCANHFSNRFPTVTPFPCTESDMGVQVEFDTDVVDALVYTVGRWLGLDADQLRESPGLKTLVSRNIQWFKASPDWIKLAGLVMAKKINHTLDCPRRSISDTQRMLLDRMIGMGQSTSNETNTAALHHEESSPVAAIPIVRKGVKKQKTVSQAKSTTKKDTKKQVLKKITPLVTKEKKKSIKTKKPTVPKPKAPVKAKKQAPKKKVTLKQILAGPSMEVSLNTDPMEEDPIHSCCLLQPPSLALLVEEPSDLPPLSDGQHALLPSVSNHQRDSL